MANPKRKMARMVRIDAVEPIDGADRIEAARVGGWTVVVGKGEFHEGDLAVMLEIDTFCPTNDSRYAHLAKHGEKEMEIGGGMRKGHVLRTARLKGVYSQGLLMRPSDVLPSKIPEYAYESMLENGVNLTSLCGVCEYEPVQAMQGSMGIMGRYDPWVAPRTDAERVQNVSQEVYDAVRESAHFASVKVDGTSMTCLYDPRHKRLRLFSHNNELSPDEGFGQQVMRQAEAQGIIEWVAERPGITCQFEACGPKINGNRLGLKSMRMFPFSLYDTMTCRYLSIREVFPHGRITDFAKSFVPDADVDLSRLPTPTDLIEWVDGIRGNVTDRLDEGIVIHVYAQGNATDEQWRLIQHEIGPQLQIKAISRRYLLKAKE